jgi:dTDP-glucose pyrophosphorylase
MHNLQRVTYSPDATIRDVMEGFTSSGVEVALITDEARTLLGILTDGDVRRALLQGATLSSPVAPHMKRSFTAVGSTVGRAEVLDLMLTRTLRHIPIVDGTGRLCGLHLLRDVLGGTPRPNCALILAGGQGARLYPLTRDTPKPMLRVAGRPILERIILQLVGNGVTRIFIAVHHLAEMIEGHFGDGARFGCGITYLRETRPLGTGGALSLLPQRPEHPLLVMNGDLVTQADIGGMIDAHCAGGQIATVGERVYSHQIPFGVLEASDGCLTRLVEKPTVQWNVNAGIYVVNPDLVGRVPAGEPCSMPDLIEACLQAGERVGTFPIEGDWIDVGRHEELQQARGLV